jgi:hypothetical protein
VTISVPAGTPTGPYNVQISASSGGSSHTSSVSVLVKPQGFLAIFTHVLAQSGLSGVLGLALSGLIILVALIQVSSRSPPRPYKKWRVGARSVGATGIFPHYIVQASTWNSLEDLRR